MTISLLLLLFQSSIVAFNSSPVSLQEELGCSPTLSKLLLPQREESTNFYFDPLGLATDENFSRYREAELKHGRVAMITFCWSWVSTISSSSSSSNSMSVIEGGGGDWGKLLLNVLRQKELPPILDLCHNNLSPTDSTKFIVICGILETLVLVQVNPQDMPGDYGLAYFGVRDKGRHEESLVSELENGRLAMLVMLYYVIHDIIITDSAHLGILKQGWFQVFS
jgi:hypothetical protein